MPPSATLVTVPRGRNLRNVLVILFMSSFLARCKVLRHILASQLGLHFQVSLGAVDNIGLIGDAPHAVDRENILYHVSAHLVCRLEHRCCKLKHPAF